MKTTKSIIASALAVTAISVHAGDTVYMEPAPATAPYVAPQGGLDWSFGASAGYLIDAEEEFYSVQLGKRIAESNGLSHFIFLEVGYSELNNDGDEVNLDNLGIDGDGESFTGEGNLEATFIPITLNYKIEKRLGEKFALYGGLGAGVAIIDIDGNFDDDLTEINDEGNDSETSFFAQAFIGAAYHFTPNFEMFGGARYMYIDDYSLTTDGGRDIEVDNNDDVLVELGGRFHF